MHSSLFHSMTRAGLALLVSSFLLPAGADAAPIREVSVSVTGEGGMPPAVEKRITASISAIGNRILVGKDESLFRSHESEYDKILADIVNRVVVGYVVDDISASYGEKTALHVSLTPVGQMIRMVETEIDYGNLSPEAAALVKKDTAGVPLLMSQLLSGLPVDSVGWAESVSESAGRELLKEILPEFTANFEVTSGEKTKVRISLIPQGTIVRTGKLTLHKTTIPRLLMLRAVNETEHALRSLEGLPLAFVARHQKDLAALMNDILANLPFIEKYGIETKAYLYPGEITELKVDALTDHWIIRTEAWMDAGRDGNRNTAIEGMLGHFVGRNNVIFGEVRFYPGPVDWNVYGGWYHHFGRVMDLGYKYDLVENSHHAFGQIPFGENFALRYDRDFKKKRMNMDFPIRSIIT